MPQVKSVNDQASLDRAHGGLMAIRLAERNCSSKEDVLKFALAWREKTQDRLVRDVGPEEPGRRVGKAARDAQRFAGGCIALRQVHERGCDEEAFKIVRGSFQSQLSSLKAGKASGKSPELYSEYEGTPVAGAWWLSDTRKLTMNETSELTMKLAKNARDAKRGLTWKSALSISACNTLWNVASDYGIGKRVFGESGLAKGAASVVAGLAIDKLISRHYRQVAISKYKQGIARYSDRLYADQLKREVDAETGSASSAEPVGDLEVGMALRPDGTPGLAFNRTPTADEMERLIFNLTP